MNVPPVVPSNISSRQPHQHALYPVPQPVVNANRHTRAGQHQPQMAVNYSYAQPQQIYSHPQYAQHAQQHVHASPRLVTNVGHAHQRRASLQQAQAPRPTVHSQEQARPQQLPGPISPSSDQALRERVVSLLSSTVNSCVVELGYPNALSHYRRLQADYSKLFEEDAALRAEVAKLKTDSARLAQLLHEREEFKKHFDNQAKTIQDLGAENKQLKDRIDLLIKQCHLLQQTNSLSASDSYKSLESKYHYALQLIRKHRIVFPPSSNNEYRSLSESECMDVPIVQGNILTGGSSQEMRGAGRAELRSNFAPQEFIPESSEQISRSLNSAPPVLVQQQVLPPHQILTTPIPARPSSLPTPSLGSVSSPVPTIQVFPKPVYQSTDDPSPIHNIARNHDNPVSSPSVANEKPEKPMSADLDVSLEDSPEGSSHRGGSTYPATLRQSTPQQGPTALVEHAGASNETHVHAVEGRPQLHVQTSFEHPDRHVTPVPAGPPAVGSTNDGGSTIPPSPPASSAQHGLELTDVQKAPEPRQPISPTKEATTAAPLTPKGPQSMDVDGDEQVRGAKTDNQHAVMSECKVSGINEDPVTSVPMDPPSGDNLPPAQPSDNSTEEDQEAEEDEEMDWGDLTDDEAEKRPAFDCICIIFEDDDETEERRCKLCNKRMEYDKDPGPRPVFTDCSLRDLLAHAKTEHEVVWNKLRQSGS